MFVNNDHNENKRHACSQIVSETDHVKAGSSTQAIEVVRFSKSGKKLAIGMGNEVIVNVINDKDTQELDR